MSKQQELFEELLALYKEGGLNKVQEHSPEVIIAWDKPDPFSATEKSHRLFRDQRVQKARLLQAGGADEIEGEPQEQGPLTVLKFDMTKGGADEYHLLMQYTDGNIHMVKGALKRRSDGTARLDNGHKQARQDRAASNEQNKGDGEGAGDRGDGGNSKELKTDATDDDKGARGTQPAQEAPPKAEARA